MNCEVSTERSGVEILRSESQQVFREELLEFSIDSHDCRFIVKVRVNDNVFHSYIYGRKLKCASYYAFICSEKVFVKIKCIFVHRTVKRCLCPTYRSVDTMSGLIRNELTTNWYAHLSKISNHHQLTKSVLKVYRVESLSHHAIIVKFVNELFGVRVICDYEHE